MYISFQQTNFRTVLAVGFILLLCLLLAVACTQKPAQWVHLTFNAEAMPPGMQINDLRFYIHDIYLLGSGGEKVPFTIKSSTVALVDLHPDSNDSVTGQVEQQDFSGIEFKLGVPFQLNHADPLTAHPPLNDGTLFWAWQQGYKFLRFDFMNDDVRYSFHLGSTGCQSASAIRPPEKPCAQPNIVEVTLQGFDPTQRAIQVDVNWLAQSLISGVGVSCTGSYSTNAVCTEIIGRLGLNVTTGHCLDQCTGQALFK